LSHVLKSIVTFSKDLYIMNTCRIIFDIITDSISLLEPETLCDFLDQVNRVCLEVNTSFESETDPK